MSRLLILGAGASHSALRNTLIDKDEMVSPPLLGEIFQKAKQLRLINPEDTIWSEINRGLGISLDDLLKGTVNFEHLLSLLDINSQQIQKDSALKLPTPFESYLKGILVRLLQVTTDFVRTNLCAYHRVLAETLEDGDTVISFNYDLIMDYALRDVGKWNQESGYRFPFDSMLTNGGNEYKWSPINNSALTSQVHLLKLHGSLNWLSHSVISRIGMMIGKPWSPLGTEGLLMQPRIEESEMRLIPIDRAYDFDITKLREQSSKGYDKEMIMAVLDEFVILPPTFYKEVFQTRLDSLWAAAAKALGEAEQISIIGYSFPDADLLFQYVFRTSIAANKMESIQIEVVNPDPLVSKKIEKMISRPVKTLFYENMKSYIEQV